MFLIEAIVACQQHRPDNNLKPIKSQSSSKSHTVTETPCHARLDTPGTWNQVSANTQKETLLKELLNVSLVSEEEGQQTAHVRSPGPSDKSREQ